MALHHAKSHADDPSEHEEAGKQTVFCCGGWRGCRGSLAHTIPAPHTVFSRRLILTVWSSNVRTTYGLLQEQHASSATEASLG
eukprot:3562699-Rhodomonas_salina.1